MHTKKLTQLHFPLQELHAYVTVTDYTYSWMATVAWQSKLVSLREVGGRFQKELEVQTAIIGTKHHPVPLNRGGHRAWH